MTKIRYGLPPQAGDLSGSPDALTIGMVTGMDEQGHPLVQIVESSDPPMAVTLSVVGVTPDRIGARVVIAFTGSEPVILGFIHSPLEWLLAKTEGAERPEADHVPPNAYVDGKRVVFEAKEEVVLQCGEASIALTQSGKQAQITIRCGEASLTLNPDGKIMIRGTHIVNRSDGVNRLLGSAITFN